MNIFHSDSPEFKAEIEKMRLADKVARLEVEEINRIAKLTGESPKYIRLRGAYEVAER
jgi:hypothetical protein